MIERDIRGGVRTSGEVETTRSADHCKTKRAAFTIRISVEHAVDNMLNPPPGNYPNPEALAELTASHIVR